MALLFGGLADDLAGGMELAALLTAAGVRCACVMAPCLKSGKLGPVDVLLPMLAGMEKP